MEGRADFAQTETNCLQSVHEKRNYYYTKNNTKALRAKKAAHGERPPGLE